MKKITAYLDSSLKNNKLVFVFFVCLGVFLSLHFRYEIISDFNNYHYYLPWAFFNHRTFTDIAIAMENSYHNPLIDMPIYFLVEYFNDNLNIFYAYMGIFYGILLFVFYKFCRLIFKPEQRIELIVTMMIAATGFATLSQIGTSSNEIIVSIGILTGLYLLYKEIFVLKKERLAIFFFAGYILGCMLGLKLTVVIYCVASGITLILFSKNLKTPIKSILMFTLGGLLGFCTINGYWMYILYQEFGNPVFPYFNNIFKSPYYREEFVTYKDFYKKTGLDYLIFPYKASFQLSERITAETNMIDARLAAGYTVFWLFLIVAVFKKNLFSKITQNKNITFLVIFCLISYVIWLHIFSIIRYAIPLEMFIALFLVKYFSAIRPGNLILFALWSSISMILLFILFSELPYKSWGNRINETKLVYDNNVKLPENSLLISLSPSTGLTATRIVKNNPDVKLANETSTFTIPGTKLHDKIDEYKKNSQYIAYLVYLKTSVTEFDKHTPIENVKNDNRDVVWNNLQFIIKTEIGPDRFYCRDILNSDSFAKVFLCIDKKDKAAIFQQ